MKINHAWIKNLGLNFFEYCNLYIGKKLITNISQEYFNLDYELNINKNNKLKLNKLIGNDDDINIPKIYQKKKLLCI